MRGSTAPAACCAWGCKLLRGGWGTAGAPPSPGLPRGTEPSLVCVLAEKEEIDHPNNSFSPCSIHDRKCLQKQQAKRVNNGNKMRNSGSPYHREETRPIVSIAWHRGRRLAPGAGAVLG